MGNTACVSHTGNWPRNPRKMALEIARQREREAAEVAWRELVFEAQPHSLLELHPCEAERRKFGVVATCTCGNRRWLDLKPLLASRLAHAPWPRVMRSLTCHACGGQPVELAFSLPVGQVARHVAAGTIRVRRATSAAETGR